MEDDEEHVTFERISIWFPLPYRVLFLSIIGVWLFAFNLHYLHIVRIDISPFLRYTRSSSEPLLHRSIYQVALLLTAVFSANLLLFWSLTGGRPEDVQRWESLPMLLFLFIVAAFLWPLGNWHNRGRARFRRMFRRILIGGLDLDLRFADILLADALTSYAKVLGDTAMVVCMFFSGYSPTYPIPNRSCGGTFLVPCVIALPYLIRLRQCLIEYRRVAAKDLPASTHLYNALKYASAFPVIIIGTMERNNLVAVFSKDGLTKGWYAAVIVNTLFSFYWDVTQDWQLTLLTSARGAGAYPYGLRQYRHFVAVEFYYIAIVIDFLLRCTWSVKLSPHLDYLNEMEGGIFMLELLEVCRRWVWVFFRVEKEFMAGKETTVEEGMMLGEFRD